MIWVNVTYGKKHAATAYFSYKTTKMEQKMQFLNNLLILVGLTNNLNTWLIQQFNLHPNTSRWEHCKHAYLGQTSAMSVSEITLSVGIWWSITTRGVPKLTSPIEAVTVSMCVMSVTSYWHILVDVSMVMVGPTKWLVDVSSHGTSMVTCGGWSLIKDWVKSWKPGGGILFWETGPPGGIFAFSVKILGVPTLLASCFIAGMTRGLVCPRKGVIGKQPWGWALLFWLLPPFCMDSCTSSPAAQDFCEDVIFSKVRGIFIQNICKGDEGFHLLLQFP